MPEPSIANLARATGRDADELAHLLVCQSCRPGAQCDENPALIRVALAAYRGQALPQDPGTHTRVNARGEVEVGDAAEFRRIRAGITAATIGVPDTDPRKR